MKKSITNISIVAILASVLMVSLLFMGCDRSELDSSNNSNVINYTYMNGPTATGNAYLEESLTTVMGGVYNYNRVSTPDAVIAELAAGTADIACLPINVAANYYNKTNGSIKMVDICVKNPNTFLTRNNSIKSLSDLKGKKIYSIGKGAVPQAVLESLLKAAGIGLDEVDIEYKSDPYEIYGLILADDKCACFVWEAAATLIVDAHDDIIKPFDVNELWDQYVGGDIVTAVTVVRTEYYQNHKKEIDQFMNDHYESIKIVLDDPTWSYQVWDTNAVLNSDICYYYGTDMAQMSDAFLSKINNYTTGLVQEIPDENFYITD